MEHSFNATFSHNETNVGPPSRHYSHPALWDWRQEIPRNTHQFLTWNCIYFCWETGISLPTAFSVFFPVDVSPVCVFFTIIDHWCPWMARCGTRCVETSAHLNHPRAPAKWVNDTQKGLEERENGGEKLGMQADEMMRPGLWCIPNM